ncbi:hypothetical protein M413DRAFT_69074 [Hebeloma cylindrosporum]|uniref:Uncharacterized protein n=1 Tax=Hebeloma cylindrosporum TaxID=76867 RepID=A0A0C3CJ15_HEBCY|nr:hypothetical protein M413DRAFT_69074 [Hebeloma cylindrosporum h7]
MFILATSDIAVSWNIFLNHAEWLDTGNSDNFLKALYPKFFLHLFNKSLFILPVRQVIRCYVVWGRKNVILYSTGVVLIMGTVFGFVSEGTSSPALKRFISAYVAIVITLNAVVTILTGEIFWIAREVRKIMGSKMVSHYHFTIGILVESGLIYTVSNLLVVILSPTKFIVMAAAIVVRVVCIMPILIIVQIALGRGTKNVQTTVSMIQAGTHPQIILDTIDSERLETGDEMDPHRQPNVGDTEDGVVEMDKNASRPAVSDQL